ncbi:hypothetical protein AR158_c240L [Paramecium bursaria Chlorella virus AR158]|uniref:hypothetical protein n=1 Tax=Paramecium bursaria Chlorella virus AR158 TaxID=380598 RepID=UPI00015AA8A4|nr:hypothetical protein AR158_c240L [Paramecium bursaria Chlorella virus AR158]ABU43785.1 hypothetical protein AR158_c240L [Paramecium bursaria Chlorella virus AR158]
MRRTFILLTGRIIRCFFAVSSLIFCSFRARSFRARSFCARFISSCLICFCMVSSFLAESSSRLLCFVELIIGLLV